MTGVIGKFDVSNGYWEQNKHFSSLGRPLIKTTSFLASNKS